MAKKACTVGLQAGHVGGSEIFVVCFDLVATGRLSMLSRRCKPSSVGRAPVVALSFLVSDLVAPQPTVSGG